jgi:predicted metalloprotease with PDZ domain
MADVELRRRSDGKQSLDRVLDGLAACCNKESSPRSAREVIARMDRIAGGDVFRTLYERWVLGPELPRVGELYDDLGLDIDAGSIRKRARARDAWIRDAVMLRDHRVAQKIADAVNDSGP